MRVTVKVTIKKPCDEKGGQELHQLSPHSLSLSALCDREPVDIHELS